MTALGRYFGDLCLKEEEEDIYLTQINNNHGNSTQ